MPAPNPTLLISLLALALATAPSAATAPFGARSEPLIQSLVQSVYPIQSVQPARTVQSVQPVHAVPSVDLARYAGRWHEVARFPNRFQRACDRNTTADYELLPDGAIRVVNQCTRADGSSIRAEGRARLANPKGPTSQLKVRFAPAFLSFLPMVWGDYWVLDLTDDYRVALVGDPGRKYLWILSRVPTVDDATYQRMVATAAAQGFDIARLVKARTDAPVQPSSGTSSWIGTSR